MADSSPVRPATFARKGWYPAEPQVLRTELDHYLAEAGEDPAASVRGVIAPHAGYRYCGHVLGATYGRCLVPEVAVIVGVDHWHGGAAFATQTSGEWELPGARVAVDGELATRLRAAVDLLDDDPRALELEHSLEMQVPFLWRRRPDVRIVPLQLSFLSESETMRLGEVLGRTVQAYEAETGRRVLLVASSDLHHQEQPFSARDDRVTRDKDERAIERILAWDPGGLFRRVQKENIGMCGFVPAAVVMTAARVLGASQATLVRHATSAEIPPHNFSYVVGYSGFLIR